MISFINQTRHVSEMFQNTLFTQNWYVCEMTSENKRKAYSYKKKSIKNEPGAKKS